MYSQSQCQEPSVRWRLATRADLIAAAAEMIQVLGQLEDR